MIEEQKVLDADKFRNLVEEAMNYAWSDWCSDTGSFPCDFEWRGGNGTLSFTAGKWAGNVADYIFNSQKFKSALKSHLTATDDAEVREAVKYLTENGDRGTLVDKHIDTLIRAATAPKQSDIADKLAVALRKVLNRVEEADNPTDYGMSITDDEAVEALEILTEYERMKGDNK